MVDAESVASGSRMTNGVVLASDTRVVLGEDLASGVALMTETRVASGTTLGISLWMASEGRFVERVADGERTSHDGRTRCGER
jgi:hypothetical protein